MATIGISNYIGFDVTITLTAGITSQTFQVGSKKSNYQRRIIFNQAVPTISLDIKTGDSSAVFQATAKLGNINIGEMTGIALYISNNNPATYVGDTFSSLPSPKTINCWSGETCGQFLNPTETSNWTFLTQGMPDSLIYIQCSTVNYSTASLCFNQNPGYSCVSNIPDSDISVTIQENTPPADPVEPPAEDKDYFDTFISGLGEFFKYFIIFVAVIFVIILIAVVAMILIRSRSKK